MHEYDREAKPEKPEFTEKLAELLPGFEFEETPELSEARLAALEALTKEAQDPALNRLVWTEYAKVCEHIVDTTDFNEAYPKITMPVQIAMIVHKALIFREAGDTARYAEELNIAQAYASGNVYYDTIVAALQKELGELHAS
jgi:hypothetical protein